MQRLQCLADIGRRLRQHRRDRSEQAQLELLESVGALPQCGLRDLSQAAGIHCGAPDLRCWQIRSCRDGVGHDTGERALAQLTEQKSNQELLFRCSRSHPQRPQRLLAPGSRAGAVIGGDCRQLAVDLGDRQRGMVRAGRVSHRPQ